MRNLIVALLVVAATPALAQEKEKLFASDISVRTVLTFKAPDTAVRKMLPAGWELNSPAAGPTRGSNFGITLIDTLMVQDPEGKPVTPMSYMVFVVQAKKLGSDTAGAMVVGGFTAQEGVPGAYGVYSPARVTVDRRSHTDAAGKTVIEENWDSMDEDGNTMKMQVEFTRGTPRRGKGEPKVYSAAKADVYRIYRLEQAADVVRSTPADVDRVSRFSIKVAGPKLSPLFNGTEQLISITSVPAYSRSIYLPVQ